MSTTLARMGRPKKSEPTEPFRMPKSVVKRIKRVALHQGMDPGDYAAKAIDRQLTKDERKMLEELNEEQAGRDRAE